MTARLMVGVALGFVAWTLMGLSRILPWPLQGLLERQAVLSACRMYLLGGGIDDGASALVEGWGERGQKVIRRLIARKKIPRQHLRVAHLYVNLDGPVEE